MSTDHRAALAKIKRFDQLIAYLRDEMGWPIARDSFEDVDDLFYDFTADELGIDPKTAAKIESIKRLRPLSAHQPWGIFFIKFEPKRLPVVALRRILSQVALKKRASANSAERAAWSADDLLFVSAYGEGEERQISFAHFSQAVSKVDLPTLKVLGWDSRDTPLHLDAVARELTEHLAWPNDELDAEGWRTRWRAAFTVRHREVVTTSRELSIRLAELARAIRDRIKTALVIETEKGALTQLMKAFQTALVHDLDAEGFADMYAQTIAYGLLSARIADPHRKTADDFAAHMRTNPFLRELMETFLKVGGRRGKVGGPGIDFDELGVSEVVELLDDANMDAVVRDFGDRNPREDPVIHFYELFLKEYDARKRMQRGVFYTPRPVVSYIVRSLDELLRTEFGLADGLADTTTWGEMASLHKHVKVPDGVSPDQDFVQILDPATGTGTFLVEVIDLIHQTLVAKWEAQNHGERKIDALWNEYVPRHLLTRLHGYELLMAPYAIAHLKVGLKLYETGYRFGSDERARVYLTNALEPPGDKQGILHVLPALAHEAQAVNEIKRTRHFTVVMGNPPYSIQSGNLTAEARAIVEPYKWVDGVRIRERNALQFEKNIQDDYVKFMRLGEIAIERARIGLLGVICNNSYLDGRSFRGMRKHLLTSMTSLRVVDLHGSLKKTEDTGPAGRGDENVFDIQQGVAITLGVRRGSNSAVRVEHLDLYGSRETKAAFLLATAAAHGAEVIKPASPFYLFLPAGESRPEYEAGISLRDAFRRYSSGVKTHRDAFAYAFARRDMSARLAAFVDPGLRDEQLRAEFGLADSPLWQLRGARRALRATGSHPKVVMADYRPFDKRWLAYSDEIVRYTARPTMRHMLDGNNLALLVCQQQVERGFRHAFVTRTVADCCAVSGRSRETTSAFPLFIRDSEDTLFSEDAASGALNLSDKARTCFGSVCARLADQPDLLLGYAYALLYSRIYRERYADQLRSDFPRILIPISAEVFMALAKSGEELIALHLLESPVCDRRTTELVGSPAFEVEKVSWSKNTVWLDRAQTAGFKGVREDVWNFHIGGYQVCEKWLKDRKGRLLSAADISHYQKIVVALAETIRLMGEIDAVIEAHGGWPGAFLSRQRAKEGVPERLLMVAEPSTQYGAEPGDANE